MRCGEGERESDRGRVICVFLKKLSDGEVQKNEQTRRVGDKERERGEERDGGKVDSR